MEIMSQATAVGPPDLSKQEIVALFPYQIEDANWLTQNPLALLASDMGLGKTAITIRACDLVGANRVCIVCPAIARINWQREFGKFSLVERRFYVVGGEHKAWDNEASLILSYEMATKYSKIIAGPFGALILDESHMIVNPETNRTPAILGSAGLAREAKRIWALSGTPAPNHYGELWALLYTFGATKLSHRQWIERYCTYYVHNNQQRITGSKDEPHLIDELKTILKPFMLRRKKEDVLRDLPPITFEDLVVEPGKVDLELDGCTSFFKYTFPTDTTPQLWEKLAKEQKLLEDTIDHLGMGADGMRALEALAPSVSTLRMYAGLQMLEPIAKLVGDELDANAYDKIILFAHHRDVIEGLRTRLVRFKPTTLYGGTPPASRQKHIDKFQNNPACRIICCNIWAAGSAITLTAASQVLMVESDWVPGRNAQAIMRAHRIGQKSPVFVRFAAIAGGVHEKINQALKRKTRELANIF